VRRFFHNLILIGLDIATINLSLYIAFLLRFEGTIPEQFLSTWWIMAVFITTMRILFFMVFGLYRSLWRYSSLPELYQIVKAVTFSTVAIWAIIIPFPFLIIPRSIGVMTWFLNIVILSSIRLSFRLQHELIVKSFPSENMRRVLIIGAGNAGAMIAREMKQNPSAGLLPIAFLDDSRDKLRHSLHGLPVVGDTADIKSVVLEYRPDEILIAIPSASKSRMREIVASVSETGLPIRTLPNLLDLAGLKVSIHQIREVKIEDLLGREPVQVDLESIADYLNGERVLVTGAGGSIGSELCRQIAEFNPAVLLLLGRGENSIYEIDQELNYLNGTKICKIPIIADIRDRNKMERVFETYRPTVVFHAAAHKHVPLMEDAPDEAVKNNVFGTKNVAELADRYGVKRFVMISTDKAVNPTSVMGATKRIAEIIVQKLARTSRTKFCAVRFGNVLGSRGSVVPLFKKQIARGGPITITHPEMRRFFMTIPEAVHLVIQAGSMGKGGEVFILDMGEPVRILDLAKDLIRLSGLEPDKDIAIKFSGVRPGEKLYEELMTAEEGTDHTKHKRIFVGKPNGVDWEKLPDDLNDLWNSLMTNDSEQIIRMIQHIVPQFTPNLVVKQIAAVGTNHR
jgi:FlaA1/EpsC-like NDP-sugar epimerase